MTRLACVLLAASACASATPTTREDPHRVQWEIGGALTGTHCGESVEIVEGPKPEDAQSLGVVRLKATARPMKAYRDVLEELAKKRCAQGASIRQAVDDGAGVVLVNAVLWERAPAPAPDAPTP